MRNARSIRAEVGISAACRNRRVHVCVATCVRPAKYLACARLEFNPVQLIVAILLDIGHYEFARTVDR